MDAITRRAFLIRSGVVAGGAMAAGAAGYTVWDLLATAGSGDPGAATLVVVTLYGGNDGLAAVVPYADPAYHDARPGLSYSAEQVLRLDDATGLNPSLRGLSTLYGKKQLAILRGVGYPKPDRSHFRSMDILADRESGTPGEQRLARTVARHRRWRSEARGLVRAGAAPAAGRGAQRRGGGARRRGRPGGPGRATSSDRAWPAVAR